MGNPLTNLKTSFRISKRKEELSKLLDKPQSECLEQAKAEIEAEDKAKENATTKQD